MALAFLQFRGKQNGHYVYHADIGTAQFFKYVQGEHKKKLKVGKNEFIRVLDGVKKASKLMELNPAMQKIGNGRFPLKIPENEIIEEARYIQLYSYPKRSIKAPTVSNILRMLPRTGSSIKVRGTTLNNSFSTDFLKQSDMQETVVRNRAFNYREPQLSQVMFWNAIVKTLPTIVKHAAPIIGGLLNPNGETAATGENADSSNDKTTQVVNKVVEVLEAIAGNSEETPAAIAESENTPTETTSSTAQPGTTETVQPTQSNRFIPAERYSSAYSLEAATVVGLKPILEKILTPEAILAIGDEPRKLFLAIKDAVQKTESANTIDAETSKTNQKNVAEDYSKATVAPALLAAMPALMPVIEKALNPELIEAIGNQPTKLFKAIGDVVLKMDEQQIKHLEAINPGVDSADDIAKLLQGMSISYSKHKEDVIKFKMVKNVDLDFINTQTVTFRNKERVLFSKKHRVAIPLKLSSKKGPIHKILPKSVIQILIKDAETMDLVFRKNIKLVNVDISKDIHEAYLTIEETKGIPCNTELKFELSYIWKSNKKENIGVFKSHYVHFIDTYVFDRIGGQIGETVLLNDINEHRNYWHKIWEGGFSQSKRWEVAFDVKYYYILNLKEKDLARLETKKSITSDNVESGQEHPKRRKVDAQLKSGMEIGLTTINNLLALFKQPPLDESMLKVLKKSNIEKSFQQVSRIRLEMKGREGDTSTLWSYPEMSLYKLHMSQIGKVDDYGQVIKLNQIEKRIPRANFIHFIGTTSEH